MKTGGTEPQAASPSARSPSRTTRRWLYVVVAVAVVVAAVLAVVLSGVLSPRSGSSVNFVSEQTAAATAFHLTNGVPGGPWQLTYVWGFLGGGPVNTSSMLPHGISCQVRNVTAPTIPTVGPSASSYRGLAQAWVFIYTNPSGSTGLTVLVQNGAATELGQWSGSDCIPGAPLVTSLIDSTEAADAVAATTYGSEFIADHPQANATFSLSYATYMAGKVQKNATLWFVAFRAPPDEIGIPVEAEVFADNGTIECVGTGSPYCPS